MTSQNEEPPFSEKHAREVSFDKTDPLPPGEAFWEDFLMCKKNDPGRDDISNRQSNLSQPHSTRIVPDFLREQGLPALQKGRLSNLEMQKRSWPSFLCKASFFISIVALCIWLLQPYSNLFLWLFGRSTSSVTRSLQPIGKEAADARRQAQESYNPRKGFSEGFVIFSPSAHAQLRLPEGVEAKFIKDHGDQFLRTVSVKGKGIFFNLDPSLLNRFLGKNVIFEIVARSEIGKPTWVAVTCNLGKLGFCYRKRYLINDEPASYLFRHFIPYGKVSEEAGILVINPDFENSGKSLYIKEVRIMVEE